MVIGAGKDNIIRGIAIIRDQGAPSIVVASKLNFLYVDLIHRCIENLSIPLYHSMFTIDCSHCDLRADIFVRAPSIRWISRLDQVNAVAVSRT